MGSTERFGYEWSRYDYLLDQYEKQFLGWIHPLERSWFKDKIVLDAGCGMGRNSYWPLKYGARKVVAFDFDVRSVEAAQRTLKQFPNADVRYGDIEKFDCDERFDLVFSIGVIHHLAHPAEALRNLARLLKPGGTLLIWVYGYEGNEWIVRYIDPLRIHVTSKLPVRMTHALAYFFSVPLYLFLHVFPQRRPYLKLLKSFRFDHVHSIVFDQLLPRIANYWRRDEVEALLRTVPGMRDISIHAANGMSWTATAVKS